MARAIKLSRVETVLEELEYPVTRNDAAIACEDVTLRLADGETNLGQVISETGSDAFASVDELEMEVMSVLPTTAVGEPGQSEGEG